MSICVFCVSSLKPSFPSDRGLLVKENVANIGKLEDSLIVKTIRLGLAFEIYWVFLTLQTNILYTVVELPGGGHVAVAISDG